MINISSFELNYHTNYAEFFFCFNAKKIEGVRCCISLRAAGDMGLDHPENRRALFNKLKVDANRVYACNQTHSHDVAVAVYPQTGVYPDADALVGTPPAVLAVTVADCLPVYLYDNIHKVYALCHSGWKGTGIVVNALRLMHTEFGTDAGDVSAVLGPCIQGNVYQVDAGRAQEYYAEFGSDSGVYPLGNPVRVCGSVDKEYYIDMQAANAHLLVQCGVQNIMYCTNCTLTDERLGSFRREKNSFTKMLAMLGSL
ncbi:MAG: polyphenol oxidase family protein [Spirochaetaceae bacterium]|jgi:YfiH family protein|nr:polyphenol oxidase family protein [Spirochaetaceae bacterium]